MFAEYIIRVSNDEQTNKQTNKQTNDPGDILVSNICNLQVMHEPLILLASDQRSAML
jgi:hypothetical protein